MKCMIREIRVTDAQAIQTLNEKELGYQVPVDLTVRQVIKLKADGDHHFLRVFEDEETATVVGYVHGEVYETLYSETLFNVLALVVATDWQKQGIGKALLNSLEAEAKARDYAAIRLNSGGNRHEAHKFYEAVGYTADKMQKRFIKRFD